MNKIPLVDLSRQYKEIKKELNPKVLEILAKGNFILGEEVSEFENEFAKYCGIKYAVGVASGRDALLLSLKVLGIGPGDEVITQANTFIATIFPIIELGATPVLVEIDAKTNQIDVNLLEKAITMRTKVILPVHLYGIPAQMDKIISVARKHRLYVLEDACQAHGSAFKGKKCGSFGDLAAFSFYPGKNLGAAGDGGMITTNNKKYYEKLKAMRHVGQSKKYVHSLFGYNSRLDTLNAAVLSVKLKHLNKWNQQRRENALLYSKYLSDVPVEIPADMGKDYLVNYHLYVIRTKKRDELIEFLKQNNVDTGIHYPIPMHLQTAVRDLNYKRGDFPITEKYSKEMISLPMFPQLTKKEIRYISDLIHTFFERNK
ncbi:DegT/DnrJ/EryC1/StrS family aminotransferase [Candidatus Woesebacteria bacterium]|nr:DegT/DnrJ/EryC1/StrS family aminotransferase [Candidatus Woesebacteria bacterium]